MPLADKIKALILKSETTIPYQTILIRAKAKGHSTRDILEALKHVHRMKDIRTVARLGTIYYDRAPVRVPIVPERMPSHLYPKRDETNDANHEIFAGMDFSQLFLDREQRVEWKYNKKLARLKYILA